MIGTHRGADGITKVPSLFVTLQQIEIPPSLTHYGSKTMKEKRLKVPEQERDKFNKFIQHIDDFLNNMILLRLDNPYPTLFYNLMKELSSQTEKTKWKFFNQKNRNHYSHLLTLYLCNEKQLKLPENIEKEVRANTFLSSTPPSGDSFNRWLKDPVDHKKCIQEAKEIQSFIEKYHQDPFSSSIGKKPSDSIVKSALANNEAFTPIQREILIVNLNQSETRPKRSSCVFSSTTQSIKLSLKKMAKKPKAESQKEIIINSEDLSDYRFVRYLNQNEDSTVNVQLSVDDHFIYSFQQYYRIPSALAEITLTGSPESLRQFINNPIDKLFEVISDLAKAKLVKYLQSEKEFDYTLFEKMEVYQYHNQRIQEYWTIQRNEELLQIMFPLIPNDFRTELAELSEEVASQFIKENKLFLPTLNKELDLIRSFPDDALNNCVKSILGKYQSVLQNIKIQISEVLSGVRKNALLKWWLNEINKQVAAFLESKNYDYTAVPENYLEIPPNNMDAVRSNLAILQKILDFNIPSYSPSNLIEGLKEIVYPKIKQLVDDIKFSITIKLGEPEGDYSVEDVLAKFNEKKLDLLSKDEQEMAEDCFKDLEYLFEMMRLEDPVYASTSKSMHIVPISGLALSTFFRLENECRTVIEYWSSRSEDFSGRKRSTNVYSNNDLSYLKFKRVISQGNLKEFNDMIKKSKCENRFLALNELDDNGWNIFHLCAAKENLSMCSVLLDEDIDVNIQNCDGNSPMHFLVRIKQPELESSLLCVIKKCIAKGADVTLVNKYHETPLHCCFRGFSSVGTLLLQHKANPHAVTLRDETPLHYAVKAENLGMIKVLLNAGADPFSGDSSGYTPYSLAIHFKNPIAESLMKLKSAASPKISNRGKLSH